jgi:DNA mismatch repair protein MutS
MKLEGTSTYDGPAWAMQNFYTVSKTLFWHYHELDEMSRIIARIQNYNVAVKRINTVLFIRKLGKREHSFGIRSKGRNASDCNFESAKALRN